MLILVLGFFYFIVFLLFVLILVFKEFVIFDINNFLLFSYLFLALPFFDLVFDFYKKDLLYFIKKNGLFNIDYKGKINTFIGNIPKTFYIIFFLISILFIGKILFNSYLVVFIFFLFGGYLVYGIKSIYIFYFSFLLFLIVPGLYIENSVYLKDLFNYFLSSLFVGIIISIFEKLDLTGKKIFLFIYDFIKKIFFQLWINIKQDYNVIFFDVLFLFLIFFVFSFYYTFLFEILVFLFSFVLFVYIIGKFFGLKFNYDISKKDFLENKMLIFFLVLIGILIFYGFSNSFYKKEIIPNIEVKTSTGIINSTGITIPYENIPKEIEVLPKENLEILSPVIEKKVFDISMFKENIGVGSAGEYVKNLQIFLSEYGYYNFTVNGIYDGVTQDAFRRFLTEKCSWNETNQGILGPLARTCIETFLLSMDNN